MNPTTASNTHKYWLDKFRQYTLYGCIVAASFPYVKLLFSTESDLQPPAIGFALIFMLLSAPMLPTQKFTTKNWVLLLMLFVPACFALLKFAVDPSFSIRSTLYFSSLLIFVIIGLNSNLSKILTPKFFLTVASVWLFFGMAQKYLSPQFGSWLLRLPRTTSGRGVYALAAEPSFYAIQLILLLILNDFMFGAPRSWSLKIRWPLSIRLYKLTEILLIFQIIFLAKSFFGILLLCIFLGLRAFFRSPLVFVLVATIAVFVFSMFQADLAEYALARPMNDRIFLLIAKVLNNPASILAGDESGGERLSDIVLSFYSMYLDPWLNIGNNSSAWPEFVQTNISQHSFLKFGQKGLRIMSGIGTAFFELGNLGILIVLAFLVPLGNFSKKPAIAALTLIIALTAAVPLSLPLVGIILGSIISRKNAENDPAPLKT